MAEMQNRSLNLGISSEEFEQYQRQFIEERSEKYALLEKVKKLEQDNIRLSSEKTTDKDFDKIIKDKFQKPFQTLLSRTKRESESVDLTIQQENDALQKRLHSQEDDFQRQNVLLMQELQLLTIKNEDLMRKFNSPLLQSPDDFSKREELEAKIRILEAELSAFRALPTATSALDGSGDQMTPISDSDRMVVELATAAAEIATSKTLLESSKKTYEANVTDLEKTVANLLQDLDGKQSSVLHLLEERDQLQRKNKTLISSAAADREKLVCAGLAEKNELTRENHELRQALEDERVMSRTRIDDVERQMKDLLEQMDVTGQQTKRDNDELLMEHKLQLASLLQQVETLTATNTALAKSDAEYRARTATLQQEQARLVADEAECSRLAEKRKATIDDLTAHLNALKRQYEEEKRQVQRENEKVVKDLSESLDKANTEASRTEPLAIDLKILQDKLALSLTQEETLSTSLAEMVSLIDSLKSEHTQQIEDMEEKFQKFSLHSTEVESDLTDKLQNAIRENKEMADKLTSTIESLEQQVLDRGEDVKIAERKTAGVTRDLQKQLQSEKKRVEKLQNKLNELLRDGTLKSKCPDDSADFTERDETGSVSSWSFVSAKSSAKKSATQPDARSNHSNTETETGNAPTVTEQEARDLVTRIAKLQQEKASLVERISMLETGNAAMAQDLVNKSALIGALGHHGPLTSKETDVFSLRSLIDRLGRDKTMDVEMQRNLRHLLEETLTKNVHLQKNMDLLTEELDRLRGSTPPRQ